MGDTTVGYPGLPAFNGIDIATWALHVKNVTSGLLQGKSNNTSTVTLSTNTSTTTVVLASGRLGPNSVILFMPTTASAAIEVSIGTMFVSTIDSKNQKFMITNANNHVNDRTFNFIIVG